MFPPEILAAEVIVEVAEIKPAVNKLPPVTLPVELTNPAVSKLPPEIFAAEVIVLVAEINPAVNTLPPVTLPLAETTVPKILDPVTVPVAETNPAVK